MAVFCATRFEELPKLGTSDGGLLRGNGVRHIQIIGTYIPILACVAFTVRKVKASSIQIGVRSLFPVKHSEAFPTSTIHDL